MSAAINPLVAEMRPVFVAIEGVCPQLAQRFESAVLTVTEQAELGPWCCEDHYDKYLTDCATIIGYVERFVIALSVGLIQRRNFLKNVRIACQELEKTPERSPRPYFVQSRGHA